MPLESTAISKATPAVSPTQSPGNTATTSVWRPAGWVAVVALLTPLLYALAWPGGALDVVLPRSLFLALHTLLEVLAVLVSLVVGLTACYVLDDRKQRISRALAAAFMGVAALDLLHLLSYAGMPDFVSANTPHKSIVLWLLARTLAAFALIVWCLPPWPQLVSPYRIQILATTAVAASALLGALAVWRPQVFPSTFEPGLGLTPLKQAAEGFVVMLLGIALAGQLKRMARLPASEQLDQTPMRDALLLMLLGELFLMVYGKEVTTSANLLGHVYKVLAYACLCYGVFLRRVKRPYLRLLQARGELELRSIEYEELLELAPVGVLVVDGQGQVQLANRALEAMFGYTRTELMGQPVEVLLPKALRHDHVKLRSGWAASDMQHTRLRSGLQGQHKDGTLIDVEVTIEKTRGPGGVRMTVCVTDVSHRRAYEAELEHRATHDSLTDLPKRWRFMQELQRIIAKAGAGEAVGVAVLDLVDFKQVNESHGSAVADTLLKEVARCLAEAAAQHSCFVARLGGDVFGVIARDVGPGQALAALAQQFATSLVGNVRAGTVEWPVMVAMGLASFPADAADADRLLRCADLALEESKRQGKGRTVLFDPALRQRAQQELRVHARLQAALRDDALTLHYQPQVDVASGRVLGFEALVRWTDAELGVVSPAVFIPVAESTGMIGTVGESVLRMACRQLQQWKAQGLDTRVSINLSPREFRHPGLVTRIAKELAWHGLPAGSLAVEVTESAVIEDFEAVAQQLQALVELGVEVHLDDFGTGHSSLAWLKAFPISTIKIDRSFVRDMVHDANDEAIVRAVISLAHTLGCSIVAEGVEHEHQLQRLRALHCEVYQGWLFSPALPAHEALAMLRGRAWAPAGAGLH